jgi:hypothetical protein
MSISLSGVALPLAYEPNKYAERISYLAKIGLRISDISFIE